MNSEKSEERQYGFIDATWPHIAVKIYSHKALCDGLKPAIGRITTGAAIENRTQDLIITNDALYH